MSEGCGSARTRTGVHEIRRHASTGLVNRLVFRSQGAYGNKVRLWLAEDVLASPIGVFEAARHSFYDNRRDHSGGRQVGRPASHFWTSYLSLA